MTSIRFLDVNCLKLYRIDSPPSIFELFGFKGFNVPSIKIQVLYQDQQSYELYPISISFQTPYIFDDYTKKIINNGGENFTFTINDDYYSIFIDFKIQKQIRTFNENVYKQFIVEIGQQNIFKWVMDRLQKLLVNFCQQNEIWKCKIRETNLDCNNFPNLICKVNFIRCKKYEKYYRKKCRKEIIASIPHFDNENELLQMKKCSTFYKNKKKCLNFTNNNRIHQPHPKYISKKRYVPCVRM